MLTIENPEQKLPFIVHRWIIGVRMLAFGVSFVVLLRDMKASSSLDLMIKVKLKI
jgi:hypothetical protein